MRSDLRRIFLTTLAAAAISASAYAGFKGEQQVVMSDAMKMANGNLGYVARTPDNVQYIGCFVAGDAGYCFAQNRYGVARSCWSDDPKLVSIMAALNSDSHLMFYWDDGGYCLDVEARSGSLGQAK